ncbi:MAG: hypothetical protein H7146_04210 [Burkholderiaceae bacterium]|nr:hypothetical protein [Microbacteriaceae bacterium]
MSQRNTVIRSMHDLGLAAWFGGGLMGAVGLNGAAAKAKDPAERLSLASVGWSQWSPVQFAAMALHGIGGIGLIYANKSRLLAQPGSRANTTVKVIVTLGAIGSTIYSGLVGTKMAKHSSEGGAGVTEAHPGASPELQSAQDQQRILQWVTPVLTAVLIILAAQQGEQQRPIAGLLKARLDKVRRG